MGDSQNASGGRPWQAIPFPPMTSAYLGDVAVKTESLLPQRPLLRILRLASNSYVFKNRHLKFLLEANILFSSREAKAANPAIWMDLEPTKKGILLNFSDFRPEASQVDCVDKSMAWILSTCWATSINLPVECFHALSTKWRTPIKLLRCRHKRTGTIQSSILALGICTDFGGPEDGWNMRHCCERIVASPQVGIAELRGELSLKSYRRARVFR